MCTQIGPIGHAQLSMPTTHSNNQPETHDTHRPCKREARDAVSKFQLVHSLPHGCTRSARAVFTVGECSESAACQRSLDLLTPLSHPLNTPASLYHYVSCVDTHGLREYLASDLLIEAKYSCRPSRKDTVLWLANKIFSRGIILPQCYILIESVWQVYTHLYVRLLYGVLWRGLPCILIHQGGVF